jgi:hypothetical protein
MACGSNNNGRLSLGDTDDRGMFTVVPRLKDIVDVDAGYQHSIAVTLAGGGRWAKKATRARGALFPLR